MQRLSLIVLLLPLCLSEVKAAPAPLPKPEVNAEVVFDAGNPQRAQAVKAFLGSGYFLSWLQSNEHARKALPNLNGEQFQAWLKANLSATDEGTLVRVRLRGSSLAMLQGLTEALAGKRQEPDKERELMKWKIRRIELILLQEDSRGRGDAEALRGWNEIENEPLKVQSAPRTLRKR
jgi:hypothetical protein